MNSFSALLSYFLNIVIQKGSEQLTCRILFWFQDLLCLALKLLIIQKVSTDRCEFFFAHGIPVFLTHCKRVNDGLTLPMVVGVKVGQRIILNILAVYVCLCNVCVCASGCTSKFKKESTHANFTQLKKAIKKKRKRTRGHNSF